MNRRILLIDADPEFYARLSDLFGRYRIEIMLRPDPDEAIADGAVDAPALIVLAVDEPDKAGFKTFQTIKKGPLAKLPIVLITKTVAPSAMQKHNGLKTHADVYLDKRSLSDDELIGRVDNLIALGEPSAATPVLELDNSLDIPLEVDDLAVGHDDLVLEETVGDDDYDPGSKTVGGRSEAVDQMVAAETDAAFDALLGFGDEPAAPSVAERLASADAAPQVIEDSLLDPVIPPEPELAEIPEIVDEAAPQAVETKEPSDVFDTFSRESPRGSLSAPVEVRPSRRRSRSSRSPRRSRSSEASTSNRRPRSCSTTTC
jgi:DNA-binding response OmpR family regulator